MKHVFTIVFLLALIVSVDAQDKYITNYGYVKFFSIAPLEDIEAENN